MTLTSCTVGPNYEPPRLEFVSFRYGSENLEKRERAAPPLDRWWEGFSDPVLVAIVQRVLDQNFELATAFARVQEARAVAAESDAQRLPTVAFDTSTTFEHQSLDGKLGTIANGLPTFYRDQRDYRMGLVASWEIDLFGGIQRGAAATQDEAQAAEADQAGSRVIVAADAADAYFQICGFRGRLAIAESQIQTDERLLKLVRDRFKAGAAQAREVAQAEALLQQARATVPSLHIALDRQLNRLDVLMGVQPGTYSREIAISRDIPSVPAIPRKAQPTEILRRRPDVIAAERRLAATSERIGAAISDYYPKVFLPGVLGLDSVSGARLFTPGALGALGAGALRWRLFDFGKVDAEVAKARGTNAVALANYRQTMLRAIEDVENSLSVFIQTQHDSAELKAEVKALTKARDLSEQAYRAGSITLTDVLDADRQLLSARDHLSASRADVARAAVGVFRSFGGGWTP
ncbi:TolC family protein [Methylocystis sp. IM3]|uniref:TolC family protein n=1 Tax=unclassified Methylocystis TaxID=2625913 RepID=UPI0030F61380